MLVEMDGTAFAMPVRQSVVSTQEGHELDALFNRPVLMLEDGFLWILSFAVLALRVTSRFTLLLHFGVALSSRRTSQRLFHLI